MAQGTCLVDGCSDEGRLVRGWCLPHYDRWRRYGDPLRVGLSGPERFVNLLRPQPSGCVWLASAPTRYGYARLRVDGVEWLAHRFAYELYVGPIPDGYTVDHECHNQSGCTLTDASCPHRRCVNFEHLAPKPIRENVNASPNSNASKTHCPCGHEYTEENTRLTPTGRRVCRACHRLAEQIRRQRQT